MLKNGLLANKIALVTGASRGIGQGIALALAQEGAKVIGTATTAEGATHITAWMQEQNLTGAGKKLNLEDPAEIESLLAEIKNEYGAINILVNNAAVNADNLILRMKEAEWEKVITTDLTSVFRLTKLCMRDMLKSRWGRIINIGSVVGSIGNPGQANYCAAKAGILGFSKSIALEVGSRGITINTVAPGFVETDMTNRLNDDQKQTILDKIPIGRIGKIEEIAAAVLFLASELSGYITGQTLHVNGGMFMN